MARKLKLPVKAPRAQARKRTMGLDNRFYVGDLRPGKTPPVPISKDFDPDKAREIADAYARIAEREEDDASKSAMDTEGEAGYSSRWVEEIPEKERTTTSGRSRIRRDVVFTNPKVEEIFGNMTDDEIRAFEKANGVKLNWHPNYARSNKQGRESAGRMPKSIEEKSNISGAKRETTGRTKVPRSRRGKRGLTVYVTDEKLEDFKAIAAAKGKGAQEYLEDFISSTVQADAHLIGIGKEKLKEPQRRRSSADVLERENLRLKNQLRSTGLKPR